MRRLAAVLSRTILSVPSASRRALASILSAGLLAGAAATLVGVGPALSQTRAVATPADLEARLTQFDAFLEDFRRDERIPSLSVAVVHDGDVAFAKGYGFQDHDGEEPTRPDTTYLVASITKTFTAATLLAMAADGKIDLEADFTSLSDWPARCEWLTNSGIIFGGGMLDNGRQLPGLMSAPGPACTVSPTRKPTASRRDSVPPKCPRIIPKDGLTSRRW